MRYALVTGAARWHRPCPVWSPKGRAGSLARPRMSMAATGCD